VGATGRWHNIDDGNHIAYDDGAALERRTHEHTDNTPGELPEQFRPEVRTVPVDESTANDAVRCRGWIGDGARHRGHANIDFSVSR
jgi:hypothetical protein